MQLYGPNTCQSQCSNKNRLYHSSVQLSLSPLAMDSLNTPSLLSPCRVISGCERLEVEPNKISTVDLANIVPKENYTAHGPLQFSCRQQTCGTQEKQLSKEFVDDPEVPPLI